jgi:catechol 2,3-dioxygenase-like lactoylglutathione lyase family enzyme
MALDESASSGRVLSPTKLAHVVLRTHNFSKMVQFYKTFLGARATYENQFLSFLTYDNEHHRIAIGAMPVSGPADRTRGGLEHIAFAFDTLPDLLLAYRQRKEKGISPIWCVNHGPTTSIYYQDPDGNQIETQVDNFDTIEEANEFMGGKLFAENPVGVEFDPDELYQQLKNGADQRELKKRKEVGPRGIESIPVPPPILA